MDTHKFVVNASVEKLHRMLEESYVHVFCLDIGAPRSVIGFNAMTEAIAASGNHDRNIRESTHSFRFGDVSVIFRGQVSIPVTTPPHVQPITVDLDIVDLDVPALLGMVVLDREGLVADTCFGRLAKRVAYGSDHENKVYVDQWFIKTRRSPIGHSYVDMDLGTKIFFTKPQLHTIHKQFYHPSFQKLFNLIKHARPEHATPGTLQLLKDISRRCDPCKRIHTAPHRFCVTMGGENTYFNERVVMDIMFLGSQKTPVLHMVDEGTRFSAAVLINKGTSHQKIWEAFLKSWATVYTGLPNRILFDEGSNFSDSFIHFARTANAEVKQTGIEAHSSLGVGERYHGPLRNTWRKLKKDSPTIDEDLALQLAVKAMNDTVGPKGLMTSALVFGEYPRVFVPEEPLPKRTTTASRAELMVTARKEMAEQLAKARITRALKHATPSAANEMYQKGDKVFVWREKIVNSRIGEWMGPFEVQQFNPRTKLVFVNEPETRRARPFGIAQVKPYLEPEAVADSFFTDIRSVLHRFASPRDSELPIFLTDVSELKDPRARSTEMTDAMRKEVKGLVERDEFKVMLREKVPPDANCMPGHFFLAIKSKEDGSIKFKARFVIGGHRNRLKHYMVQNLISIQPSSIRLLLALAAMFGFAVWSRDVTQAYLQSTGELGRKIFITKVAPEFELEPHECRQLLKPLYGLSESGDHWFNTLDDHHRKDLAMEPFKSDPALYKLMADGIPIGLSGSYVDEMMRAGNNSFKEACKSTHHKFEMKPYEELPCLYSGFVLDKGSDEDLLQYQEHYLRKLEELPANASLSAFRSMRMKLVCLSHTRPDCQFEISQLAQVTPEIFDKDRGKVLKRLNRAIRYAISSHFSLLIPKLDVPKTRVVGFSDASFANNADLSTQLGYICILVDGNGNSAPLQSISSRTNLNASLDPRWLGK